MARLQIPTQAQVAPGQIPGVDIQAPQSQAGAVAAQQTGALGQAIGQAAQQAERIQIDVLQRANTLRVNQAMNDVRRQALDLEYGDDGFRARKGEQAMPLAFDGKSLTQAYDERYRKTVDDVFQSLGNDAQRAAFREQADRFGQAFQGQAQTYEFEQMRVYEQSVLDGGIMLAADEASTAYDNPERVRAAIDQIGVLGNEKLTTQGLSGNERTARVQVLQSAAVMQVIKAAADSGDLSLARSYANIYDDVLTGEDKLKFDAMITPAIDAELARTTVTDIMSGRDTKPVAEITGEDVVLQAPFDMRPNSNFGPRAAPPTRGGNRGSSNHGGQDYAVGAGTAVPAAGRGTVKFAGERGGYGNLVIIEHPDGRETWYAHLSSINVRPGQSVDNRAVIAKSGDTGNVSGAHLHFEVRVGNRAVDPSTQLGERNAGASRRADAAPRQVAPPRTRAELEQRALDAIGPRATPEQVVAVRREVDRTWALQEEAQEARAASALEAAQNWLVNNNGNYAGMPASMRAAVPAKYQDNLVTFADKFAKKDEVKETPPAIYYQLQDDRELMALSDAEFLSMRAQINSNDWENAARRRQALRAPNPEQARNAQIIPRDRLNAITDTYFTDLGIPRTGGGSSGRDVERRRRVGAIQQVIDATVLDAQAAKGGQLNDDELRRLVQPLFSRQSVIDRGLLGGRREQALFATTESQIKATPEWSRIQDHYRRVGVANPSDTQVETAYYRLKMGLPIR